MKIFAQARSGKTMGRPRKPVNQLQNYIRMQMLADVYPAGFCLPSLNSLGEKFNLCYGVTRNAVLELVREGLLAHDRYHFRVLPWRNTLAPGGKRIAVLMQHPHCYEGLSHEVLMGMLEPAFRENMHFSLFQADYRNTAREEIMDFCRGMDGAVFLYELDTAFPDLEPPVPTVGVMMNPTGAARFSTVNLDAAMAAKRAAGYFRQRHVQEVIIYSAARPVFLKRARLFAEAFTAKGGHVAALRTGDDISDIDIPEKAGIYASSDHTLILHCMSYQKYSGIWLPDRHVTLGTDGKSLLLENKNFGSFSTLACDWFAAGRIVMRELQRLMADPCAAGQELEMPVKLICK